MGYTDDNLKEAAADIRLGRVAQPEDIARVVLFLTSDLYVAGERVQVSGGRYF